MYRIRLIRKNGTCSTEFAKKSSPPMTLSSQVIESKSTKFESVHNEALAATIYVRCSISLGLSLDHNQSADGELTGIAITSLMTMPAHTAIAACRYCSYLNKPGF